jgi:hypothetical protein
VFFFDRQYLEALPEDTVALLDAETPTLEPKIGLFDGMTKKKKKKNSIVQQQELLIFFFYVFYFIRKCTVKSVTKYIFKTVIGTELQTASIPICIL